MVRLTVDGPLYASSMVMLDSARRKTPVPALARWLLGLGIRRSGGQAGMQGGCGSLRPK